MPTYEYECKECSHNFEVFQAMSDEPLKTCPECGKDLRRLIFGGAGVIFKGSGFYVTDKAAGKTATGGAAKKDKQEAPCAAAANCAAPCKHANSGEQGKTAAQSA